MLSRHSGGSIRSSHSQSPLVASAIAHGDYFDNPNRFEELGHGYSDEHERAPSVVSVPESHRSFHSRHSETRLDRVTPKPAWEYIEVPYFRDFVVLLLAILRYSRKISSWNQRRKDRKLERRLLREATQVHAHPTSISLDSDAKGQELGRVWPSEPTEGRIWRKNGHAGWRAEKYKITPLGWEAMQTVDEERRKREQL